MSSSSSRYDLSCNLTCHTQECQTSTVRPLSQRRYVSAALLDYIKAEKLIKEFRSNREYGACVACIENINAIMQRRSTKRGKAETSLSPTPVAVPKAGTSTSGIEESVNHVCSAIASNQIPKELLTKLVLLISEKMKDEIVLQPSRKPDDRLHEIFTDSYLTVWQSLPDSLFKIFLQSFRNESNSINEIGARKLMKATDAVRSLLDAKYISNYAIGEAILLLQYSKSRYAVELFSKTCPSGSFSTVIRTISTLSKPSNVIPSHDVIIVFDNNQVLQRTWSIKYRNKMVVSTVTTMVYYEETQKSTNQFKLKIPTALFPNENNKMELLRRYYDFEKSANETCKKYRRIFIETRIKQIFESCRALNGATYDAVSDDVKPTDLFVSSLSYDRVPKVKRAHEVFDLDCLEENPNSFKSVAKVFDRIVEYSNQPGRNFIPVYCDGSPYSIGMKIVKDTYTCSFCAKNFPSSECESHQEEHLNGKIEWSRTYKKILIRPGMGHFEICVTRALLQLMWTPFVKPIAKIMGFSTESSLNYCKSGCDHHKSFDLLMVIFCALGDEILYEYVKHCNTNKEVPTFHGFCEWEQEKRKNNLTFRLASDFALGTLHLLQLFRSAIRQCNDNISLFAREKLSDILYINNNIKYHEIICNDTLFLLSLSPEERQIIGKESSTRKEGDVAEGYDFLLENRNKTYKSFLPSDSAPSFDQWLNVTRTTRELVKLRESAAKRLDLTQKAGGPSHHRLGKEVHEARKYIRSTGILERAKEGLLSLEEAQVVLRASSLNFVNLSEKNKRDYFEAFLENKKVQMPLLRIDEDIIETTNKSASLKAVIDSKISALREPFQSFYKTNLKKVKQEDDLQEFYAAVLRQLDSQNEKDFQDGMIDFSHSIEED